MQSNPINSNLNNSIESTQQKSRTNNIKKFFFGSVSVEETNESNKMLADRKINFLSVSLSTILKENNLNKALELIKRLSLYSQKASIHNDNLFLKNYLELYHLVNHEYKYLFTQEINKEGNNIICFDKYIVRTITSKRINKALVADVNALCINVSNCILKEKTDQEDEITDNIIPYLMLLEKNIHENFTDYNLNHQTDFFEAYINKSLLLFVLFLYGYGKEFHYFIKSKYLPTNLNISKYDFSKSIQNYFPKIIFSSDYLLTEMIINHNEIEGINLSFIKNNSGDIDRDIIMSLLSINKSDIKASNYCIDPEVLLSIIEESPENYFDNLPWSVKSLQYILHPYNHVTSDYSKSVLEYVKSITDKSEKQHKYLMLYKLLKSINITQLKNDADFPEIKYNFSNLFVLLLAEDFGNNQLKTDLFIYDVIIPILLDFNNEVIDINKFIIESCLNKNIILQLLSKLETVVDQNEIFIRKYNFSIMQFITYAINSRYEKLKIQGIKLYNYYLQLDFIKKSTNYNNFNELPSYFAGIVCWKQDDSTGCYVLVLSEDAVYRSN